MSSSETLTYARGLSVIEWYYDPSMFDSVEMSAENASMHPAEGTTTSTIGRSTTAQPSRLADERSASPRERVEDEDPRVDVGQYFLPVCF
jgi:hypothetical protein